MKFCHGATVDNVVTNLYAKVDYDDTIGCEMKKP